MEFSSTPIDKGRYGVSFSLKQCRNFGVDSRATLDWLIAMGWRRFRLMSYWDEHETVQGTYNFAELDWQLQKIQAAGGVVTICLGVKQPRWPEYHWPDWAWHAEKSVRDQALLTYVGQVVARYRNEPTVIGWQLENEALLSDFGVRIEIDRTRLQQEFVVVRRLDPKRPIAMSTSNGWGIPLRPPFPDTVGFSYYPIMYKNAAYRRTIQKPWLHRLRKHLIHVVLGKWVFLHELQCEPWGPEAIWKMDTAEQDKSMSPARIAHNLAEAKKIKAYPIDLWGGEWWYWRWLQGDPAVAATVRSAIAAEAA